MAGAQASAARQTRAGERERLTLGEMLELLAENGAGIKVVDGSHRISAWDDGARALLGYTAEDAVGRPCAEVMRGCDREGEAVCRPGCEVIEQAQSGEPVRGYELVSRAADGTPVVINVNILVVRPSDLPGPVSVHLMHPAEESAAPETPATARRSEPAGPQPVLSRRETEVLRLLAAGNGVSEIAAKLVVSTATVRNHISNILGKLGVHSRLQAVVHAARHGLL